MLLANLIFQGGDETFSLVRWLQVVHDNSFGLLKLTHKYMVAALPKKKKHYNKGIIKQNVPIRCFSHSILLSIQDSFDGYSINELHERVKKL